MPDVPIQPRVKTPFIDPETKALFELGFIVPLDFAFLATELLAGLSTGIWIISAAPNMVHILVVLVVMSMVALLWILTICYRACYFTLKMRAVMETMPEQAAKIAFKILETHTGTPAKQGAGKV